jgi:hypothetical protein
LARTGDRTDLDVSKQGNKTYLIRGGNQRAGGTWGCDMRLCSAGPLFQHVL